MSPPDFSDLCSWLSALTAERDIHWAQDPEDGDAFIASLGSGHVRAGKLAYRGNYYIDLLDMEEHLVRRIEAQTEADTVAMTKLYDDVRVRALNRESIEDAILREIQARAKVVVGQKEEK